MNEPQTQTVRIIGWLKKPKFWLGFVIAAATIGSAFFLLFPCSEELLTLFSETSNVETASLVSCYDGLSAWLITLAGGFLAVAVLLQTMKRADAAEKAVDQTKESIVQKTFNDAITHLGHKSESVILGGIHSLLDLAKKNSEYRPKIFNILCAHIKTTTATEEYQKKHEKQPSTTIQTLLTLLFISEKYNLFLKYSADLSGAYLAGSHLSRARLQGSNLAGAQLQRAKLFETKLQGAILTGAQLKRASLLETKLQGAMLRGAQLKRASLFETKLQGAFLSEAKLQGAFLTRAKLQGAYLRETQLQGAFLMEAQLQGAFLMKAQLQGAKLFETKLQGANLEEAQLQGAILEQTEMQGAYMHQTQLSHETHMGSSDLRGVSSRPSEHPREFKMRTERRFKMRIEKQIGKKTDLTGVVFDETEQSNLARLLDEGTVQTGSYTKEEADRWIKEYEEALEWENHQD